MKKLIVLGIILSACSKETKTSNVVAVPEPQQMVYDTMAIDSFGPGATSEAVMAKINAVAIKKQQDSLAKIAKAEQEKLDKEKAIKEKENLEKEKKETKPVSKPELYTPTQDL